jgi:hypothetical protein
MASYPDAAIPAANLWSAQHIVVEVDGPEGTHREILVDKPFARVGRDQRSEVPLADGNVLPCHLYLHATEQGVYCVGLAPDARSGWLMPSENVEIGPFRLRVRLASGESCLPFPPDLQVRQNAPGRLPHFRLVSGGHPARLADLRLRRPLALLGREPPATRRIRHRSISRVHCAVFWDGQELWMVDLFSSNGTRLAGRKFDAGRLAPGQEFKLGSVRFSYLGGTMVDGWEADSSTLEQPVTVLDDADRRDSDSRLPVRGQAAAGSHEDARRDDRPTTESTVDALRQECERLERERDEFETQLQQERLTNQECLAAVREELAKEVTALRQGSESAEQALRRLSGEVASTREALFALYADVGAKLAEETGEVERADKDRPQIAEALQWAEDRRTELAEDLNGRILDIRRQLAEDREARQALASSMRIEREKMHRRLRNERRTYRKRLATARREFAAEMAGLGEQATIVCQDLRSLEAAMARTPTKADEREDAEDFAAPRAEAAKRREEALLLAESRWENQAEEFQRRASELAQQVTDCRQADAQMAESFKAALRETIREFQLQQRAQSLEVAATKDELLAGAAMLREQIDGIYRRLETQAAELSPLEQTLETLQPALRRLESGEWAADLQRRWHSQLQAAIDQVDQRIADIDRRSSLDRQALSDQVALLEGTMAANIADLRGGLDALREMADRQRSELAPIAASDAQGPNVGPSEVGPLSPLPLSGQTTSAAARLRQRAEEAEDVEGLVSPEWVISDEVTRRLLDFNTSRERTTVRRRILWTALAAGLAAIIVSGAGVLQFWLDVPEPIKNNEAATLGQSRLSAR